MSTTQKIDADSMKKFFRVMRTDIENRCVLTSPGSINTPCDLKGQACMIEACPYNGICEIAYKMSDALIEHVVEMMHD